MQLSSSIYNLATFPSIVGAIYLKICPYTVIKANPKENGNSGNGKAPFLCRNILSLAHRGIYFLSDNTQYRIYMAEKSSWDLANKIFGVQMQLNHC
jgi:hypothetical protein